MSAGEEMWAEIRRCYEETTEPAAQIAKRYGLERTKIARRAKKDGWLLRAKTTRVPVRPPSSPSPAQPVSRDAAISVADNCPPVPSFVSRPPDAADVRIERLYRVIDLQLESLEREMSSGEPVSAQDQERRARALHIIIESFENAKEAATELLKREQHAAGDSFADAERSRRELAARIEKLGTRWDAENKS